MRKQLPIDNRVAMYGNGETIEQAEIILLKNMPDLPSLSESQARIKIQEVIDSENIKADILFDGNSIWSKKKILRDIKRVKKYGMEKLSNYLYEFFHLSCGSIAHYNKYGWISTYPTVSHLRQFFRRNEFGERVLNHLPAWKTDAQVIVKAIEQELGVLDYD